MPPLASTPLVTPMIISGRFFYVLPFAVFFAPYIIVKVYVDKSRLSAPFKWLIKYAVLEIALGLLVLLTYLFFSESWEHYTSLGWFLWVFLLVPQAALFCFQTAIPLAKAKLLFRPMVGFAPVQRFPQGLQHALKIMMPTAMSSPVVTLSLLSLSSTAYKSSRYKRLFPMFIQTSF